MQKKKKFFKKPLQKVEGAGVAQPKGVVVDQTLLAIEKARISEQGTITYHFESKNTYHDYSKYDMNNLPKNKLGKEFLPKPDIVETETSIKWSVVQPLNKEIFKTESGAPRTAESIKLILINTANDKGAKYFTI